MNHVVWFNNGIKYEIIVQFPIARAIPPHIREFGLRDLELSITIAFALPNTASHRRAKFSHSKDIR
jgi:hypothetical protein